MGREQWSWLHQRMHGELAGAVVRDSAAAVQQVRGAGWLVEVAVERLLWRGGCCARRSSRRRRPLCRSSYHPYPALLQELLACYALIEKHGRGVVYYGSAR